MCKRFENSIPFLKDCENSVLGSDPITPFRDRLAKV